MWWPAFGLDAYEGWFGLDQYSPDNEVAARLGERYGERFDNTTPMNFLMTLTYDTARLFVEGLHRTTVLHGPGVKEGIERVRFLSCATGGPRTFISAGPYDHKVLKGDFFTYAKVDHGKWVYEGLFEPWV